MPSILIFGRFPTTHTFGLESVPKRNSPKNLIGQNAILTVNQTENRGIQASLGFIQATVTPTYYLLSVTGDFTT